MANGSEWQRRERLKQRGKEAGGRHAEQHKRHVQNRLKTTDPERGQGTLLCAEVNHHLLSNVDAIRGIQIYLSSSVHSYVR